VSELLSLTSTSESVESLVERSSLVRRRFDDRTQDSGNVSWLVESDGHALFVKSAGSPSPAPFAPRPLLDHAGRVELLDNAVELALSCDHPALARLRNVIATATGPALVYDAAPGELVFVVEAERTDPASPYQRFARLPGPRLMAIFDVLIDIHDALAAQGWVASDLYDGCLMLASDDALTVIDLDTYHRGPFVNRMGRMFGSDRFMAPEEHQLGATIDQRTTVFTLARLITHFGTRLTDDLDRFVGSHACVKALIRACSPDRSERFATVAEFAAAWTVGR
jgi:hypothetical protein